MRLTVRATGRRRLARGWGAALVAAAAVSAASPAVVDGGEGEDELGGGGNIERIGIDQLIDVSVRRAPDLARARANAGIARADERSVRGRDDWQVQLAIDGSTTSKERVAGQPVQATKQERIAGSAAVLRSLPTGGDVRLEVSAIRTRDTNVFQDPSKPATDAQESVSAVSLATGRLTVNHSLLRGFGPRIARADREQAVIRTSAAAARARVSGGELTRDLVRGYWEVAHAALALEVRRASLASVQKLFKETEQVVREGGRPGGDLKIAEYTMAVREEAVLRAELALEEQGLELRKLAGLEIGRDEIALWPADLPGVGAETYSVGVMVERGLARNYALKAIALDEEDASIDVRVAQNGVLPRLDFTVSAGASATGQNADDSFRALNQGANLDASAALTFSIDIGANTARGRRDAAVLRKQTAHIGAEELRREIASAIVLAVHQIRAAQKRVQVATKAIELAKGSLTSERALFRVGRSTSDQLFKRQDELDDARLSRVRAIADYHEAVAVLQSLTGDILRRYRIEVLE
ncbi:MAG TPA: TolC family protein [Kofleriaceae bacterium]|nr:TolC family protein [Kofleriaceae bacterium]